MAPFYHPKVAINYHCPFKKFFLHPFNQRQSFIIFMKLQFNMLTCYCCLYGQLSDDKHRMVRENSIKRTGCPRKL